MLAAREPDSPGAAAALSALCSAYWYPLYAYVRRRGYGPEDAQDLTQEFFARLLGQEWLRQADRERGRFRTFLLAAMTHLLNNEWDKAHAQKRGGKIQLVPIELETAETRYSREPADTFTPEQAYERRWAVTLLGTVLERLQREYALTGKGDLFEELRPCLLGDGTCEPYKTLAVKLGMAEGPLKVLVHRLRTRYRQLLRDEIAQTVTSPGDVEDEMHHLFTVLAYRRG